MIVNDNEPEKLKDTDKVYKFNDVVKFEVKYPADYGITKDADGKAVGKPKPRHHKDGEVIELHRLQAEDWEKRKLGKIIK